MSFECPAWLQQWLGIAPSAGEESIVARIELLRPVSATLLLLAAAFVIAVAVRGYWTSGNPSLRGRRLPLLLRLLTFVVLALMIGELSLTLRRAGLPYVALLIDDSESMNIADRYADEKQRKAVPARIAKQFPSPAQSTGPAPTDAPASRWNLLRTLLLENDAEVLRRLGERSYRLQTFTVSDAARRLPDELPELRKTLGEAKAIGPATRLGDGLRAALDELRGRPISAAVILSDGVNTAGADLADVAAVAGERKTPIFTVGFGETKKAIDVEVAELKVRDRVTINDPVSFDFNVLGRGVEGKKVKVVLRAADGKTPLAEKEVKLGPDDAGQPVRLTYRPTKTGAFRYVVEIAPLPEEATLTNNRVEAAVDVRTDQISVLLVESYPSFEFRYLKQMLVRDSTVKLTCVLQEADPDYPRTDPTVTTVFPVTLDELLKYDVVIFGDVDPDFLGPAAIGYLRDYVLEKGHGVVFAAGPRFLPQGYRGTPLAELLPIDWAKSEAPTAKEQSRGATVRLTPAALEEPVFQLADDGSEPQAVWRSFAPLYFIWRAELKKTAQVMVETYDEKDGTSRPVVALQRAGRGIVLFHATDETWRWRFRVGDAYFARYWVQALRYLCLAHDGGRPAVLRVADDQYELGKPVVVEVRFQDERFVPPSGEVDVVVESDGRPNRTVRLAPRRNLRNLFETTLSGLAEGKYRVHLAEGTESPIAASNPSATPEKKEDPTTIRDEFAVVAARAESYPIEADFTSLNAAAAAGKGGFFYWTDLDKLLAQLPPGKLSPTEPLPPVPLWNRWFAILLLLMLLVAEWVLRKRRGLV